MTDAIDGLLVLDKPRGPTSRAALDRALRWFPRRTKAGHTGTLDPLATGVLVVCLGGATRLAEHVQQMGKAYRSTFRLGARSDTDDADGAVTETPDARPPSEAELRAALAGLVGEVAQVPPAYSAAKVAGRRAYDLARQGAAVDLAPRVVRVYSVDLLRYEWPFAEVGVSCGKGTYIRSLARDAGERLGCGALVEALRRTRVGPFTPEMAVPLEADAAAARAALRPAAEALAELPRATLGADEARRLRRGQAVPWRGGEGVVAVFDAAGEVVGVGRVEGGLLRPEKVLGA